MNTLEKIKAIQWNLVTKASEVRAYNWSCEFCVKEIKSALENHKDELMLDPSTMTEQECIDAGFQLFSKEDNLRLIPLFLLNFLVDEFEKPLACIDGSEITSKSKIDSDHRFGSLAYGIKF